MRRNAVLASMFGMIALFTSMLAAPATAAAPSSWFDQPNVDLSALKPGTVLKTRTLAYHVTGIPLPLPTQQIMFRTTDQLGRPSVGVTTVIKPLLPLGAAKAVSYQSFYDSLSPADQPSRVIAGDQRLPGGAIANIETLLIAPLLLQGFTVIVPDTQGQTADFAAGREYGTTTLDSVRATLATKSTGLGTTTKVGMIGYSGGAIATGWASQLAPSYAPELSKNLVGAAEGGVLVDPAHNLGYISGSSIWAGVAPMAIIGIGRAFDIDFSPYLSAYGQQVFAAMKDDSIAEVLGAYPGLTFAQLVKPQFANPNSIPEYVTAANALNMGSAPSPTLPMFIGQGANGALEGTPSGGPGIGPGDGVMIAGDVRSLARQFCADGTRVTYAQYDATSHFTSVPVWLLQALPWLLERFNGGTAPSNCGSIAPGNSLAPEVRTR